VAIGFSLSSYEFLLLSFDARRLGNVCRFLMAKVANQETQRCEERIKSMTRAMPKFPNCREACYRCTAIWAGR